MSPRPRRKGPWPRPPPTDTTSTLRGAMSTDGPPPAGGRAGFVSALIPVVARAVEVGAGPPGLVAWVRAARPAGSAFGRDDRRLVLVLAERLADHLAGGRAPARDTLAQQHHQTVRAEHPRLEGGQPGEGRVR